MEECAEVCGGGAGVCAAAQEFVAWAANAWSCAGTRARIRVATKSLPRGVRSSQQVGETQTPRIARTQGSGGRRGRAEAQRESKRDARDCAGR